VNVTTAGLRHDSAASGPDPTPTPKDSARLVHREEVLGKFVTLDLRDAGLDRPALGRAARRAVSALHDAQQRLRPAGRPTTGRTQQSNGLPPDVVLRCEQARQETQGWFDPWSIRGGFDPAVLARGWALQRALDALTCSGVRHAMVEIDGDAVVIGSASGRPAGAGWSLALMRPATPSQLLADVRLHDEAIATCAAPRRARRALARGATARLTSATVAAPDLASADAYAAAALTHGAGALDWLPRLVGVRALLVTSDGRHLTTASWTGQGRVHSAT